MFTNNSLDEAQFKQIQEKTSKDVNLVLNENEKIFNSVNQKDWAGLDKNNIIKELSDLNYFRNPGCKNILKDNSINIFNNYNNLIDNTIQNCFNFNNSNLFTNSKIKEENDIKKENLKNNQTISSVFHSLTKENNESLLNSEKILTNNNPLNNTILPNNNIIDSLYNQKLLINPNNNLLINPNDYFLNGLSNRFIYPGLNQFLIYYPFEKNLFYFPFTGVEENSSKNLISFQQKTETSDNFSKENPENFKENKNKFIGKKTI